MTDETKTIDEFSPRTLPETPSALERERASAPPEPRPTTRALADLAERVTDLESAIIDSHISIYTRPDQRGMRLTPTQRAMGLGCQANVLRSARVLFVRRLEQLRDDPREAVYVKILSDVLGVMDKEIERFDKEIKATLEGGPRVQLATSMPNGGGRGRS